MKAFLVGMLLAASYEPEAAQQAYLRWFVCLHDTMSVFSRVRDQSLEATLAATKSACTQDKLNYLLLNTQDPDDLASLASSNREVAKQEELIDRHLTQIYFQSRTEHDGSR